MSGERLPVYNRRTRDVESERGRVEAYLRQYLGQHGYSPTYTEIVAGARLASKSNVAEHLDALEAAGIIERAPGKARSIHMRRSA